MELMPAEIEKTIPGFEDIAEAEDPMCVVKFFNPLGNWQWFVYAYEPSTRICSGFVNGDFPEDGDFCLDELEALKLPLHLGIERDINWTPKPVSEVRALVEANGRA